MMKSYQEVFMTVAESLTGQDPAGRAELMIEE